MGNSKAVNRGRIPFRTSMEYGTARNLTPFRAVSVGGGGAENGGSVFHAVPYGTENGTRDQCAAGYGTQRVSTERNKVRRGREVAKAYLACCENDLFGLAGLACFILHPTSY